MTDNTFNPTTSLLTYGDMLAVFKLYDAIGKASAEFADVPKNTAGQYGNQKFSYAPYHVLRKCIVPALTKYGVSVMQPTHTEGDKVAVTLIVSGHDAAISSTILFKADQTGKDRYSQEVKFDVQLFGREHTYWRRYQLQSFFCLEGDKDADDPPDTVVSAPSTGTGARMDTGVSASKGPVSKPIVATGAGAESPKESKASVAGNTVADSDKRSVNEKLLDAKKQLNWEIPKDFDAFAKEHIEEFPDYVTATKMTNEHKTTMWRLLVEHKGVAPF